MNNEHRTMNQAVQAMATKDGKYLTFSLAGEEYGISILKIIVRISRIFNQVE